MTVNEKYFIELFRKLPEQDKNSTIDFMEFLSKRQLQNFANNFEEVEEPLSEEKLQQCPLCQNDNKCGSRSATPCWCMAATFPKEIFDKLMPAQIKKACICQSCLEKYQRIVKAKRLHDRRFAIFEYFSKIEANKYFAGYKATITATN